MAQILLGPEKPTWANYLSGKWSIEQLRLRILDNISNRKAWSILNDQPADSKSPVLMTLYRYAITWTPEDDPTTDLNNPSDSELDDDEFSDLPLDGNRIIQLYSAAELDFEKGLLFVNEVAKGSHLKPTTLPRFRAEAVKALCEVVQEHLEKLDPESEDDSDDDEKGKTDSSEDDHDSSEEEQEDEEESDDEDEEDDDEAVSGSKTAQQSSKEKSRNSGKSKKGEKMTKEQMWQLQADKAAQELQEHKDLIAKVYQSSEEQFKSRLRRLVQQHRQKEKTQKK